MRIATCLAVYFYCQPVPMLNVVAWNVFFIVLNLVQFIRLKSRRRLKPTAAVPGARPLPRRRFG